MELAVPPGLQNQGQGR